MAAEILNIQRQIIFDESIAHYEAHAHLPYASSTFNNSDEIRIAVQHQDVCLLPSKSTLHVYGKLTKSDGTAVSATTHIINMTVCHMFEEIRYELNGVEIDRNKNVGITSLMKGYTSLSPAQQNTLENSDYHKVVINAKHELTLIRSNADLNAYIVATPAAGAHAEAVKITLQKIEWIVPYVTMADKQKIEALNYMTSDPAISISFRAWELYEYPLLPNTSKHIWAVKTSTQLEKPRFVILGFQTARKNDATKNASVFDHCDIRNIKLFLNSQSYPYKNLNLNIANNQYALLYDMYINFQISYYNKEPEPLLTKKKFLEQAPLYVIDCSKKKNESLKSGPVDIRLEFESTNQFPAQTSAYCLIIHDRIVEYNPISSIVRKLI
ncbi:uncharacterized protein LOC128668846 [Microplitis demolitor]|uniref:uncharacterized protein LOC103578989 n=1 Tax=Microplitis demolitor TaxID=69319 RepID=UPI0006D4F9A2|nr:uncharacterized protein LOC103578989 [Microplitis demolitor]XP_053598625.1 uncharacterized protein LOC128668846 [Microplitis demolitor]